MLENIRGDSRGSIPPLRMPSLLPHDLCHEWDVSRRLPAPNKFDQEDPLEEGTAAHSSILAWRIPMDKGAWWATVHGVTKSQTQLNSNFLEEISSLSHSVVFLYFFALIAEEGFLISSCYSLELCIKMFISFLSSFALRFSSFHNYL